MFRSGRKLRPQRGGFSKVPELGGRSPTVLLCSEESSKEFLWVFYYISVIPLVRSLINTAHGICFSTKSLHLFMSICLVSCWCQSPGLSRCVPEMIRCVPEMSSCKAHTCQQMVASSTLKLTSACPLPKQGRIKQASFCTSNTFFCRLRFLIDVTEQASREVSTSGCAQSGNDK